MNATGTLGTTGTFEYDYNDIYELEEVSNADSHSYAYDNVGNRTTVDSVSYTTNSLNEYTAVGATSFMYDGNDNLSYDGTNSYTYDEANRLISASNSSHSASYEYDAFNRRVSKTVDSVTTYYVYDGNEVIEEYNSSNVLQANYVMGSRIDEPLTMTRSSTTYYYNTDGLGSVRQVLNSGGSIVESYDYDPYGNVTIYNSSLTDITTSGSGIDNPYMFTGRRFDEETGIYHYRHRAYDPNLGRFLQRDPLGYWDSMNLFEYVRSNPVNFIDPLGLLSETDIWQEIFFPNGDNTIVGSIPTNENPDRVDLRPPPEEFFSHMEQASGLAAGISALTPGGQAAAGIVLGIGAISSILGDALYAEDPVYEAYKDAFMPLVPIKDPHGIWVDPIIEGILDGIKDAIEDMQCEKDEN